MDGIPTSCDCPARVECRHLKERKALIEARSGQIDRTIGYDVKGKDGKVHTVTVLDNKVMECTCKDWADMGKCSHASKVRFTKLKTWLEIKGKTRKRQTAPKQRPKMK